LIYDLAILNGNVCTEHGLAKYNIGVEDGRIATLSTTALQADAKVNAEGLLVLPGTIDVHFHCRDPGYTYREDFESGTKAALSGGTTTLLEMPVSIPPVKDVDTLNSRKHVLAARSYLDYGLYGGCGTLKAADMWGQKENGVIGFKIFLHDVPPGKEEMMRGLCIPNETNLLEALQIVSNTSLPVSIHAEDAAILDYFARNAKEEGRTDALSFYDACPNVAEEVAVRKIIALTKLTGANTHFAHVSASESLTPIRYAKKSGLHISAETCPHYLLFTKDALRDLGPFAKVSPPLRTTEDISALWRGISDGTIDMVASDHAPYRREEKERGKTDIWAAPSGLGGGELLTSIMLSACLNQKISIAKLVELLSLNPAKRFGLSKIKGNIKPGMDADIILADPKQKWRVDAEKLLTKSRDSAHLFDGIELTGKITTVFLRGNDVYSEGSVTGKPGYGKLVIPDVSTDKRLFAE
jgi:dihydropyrimidinase/allantoinase